MLKHYIWVLGLCLIVLSGNKGGRNQASTKAPFETTNETCSSCHSGGSFNPVLECHLIDEHGYIVNQFLPGKEYTVQLMVNHTAGSPKSFGFQAVMVNEKNDQAGTILALGEKVRKLTIQNRIYLTQLSPKTDGLFTFQWQAPYDADTIKLYMSGLATNGNNNTGGDKGTFKDFTFSGSTANAVYDLNKNVVSLLSSNVICNGQLQFDERVEKLFLISSNGSITSLENGKNVDLGHTKAGLYFIIYTLDTKQFSEKILILNQ